ncbi:putative leader peptide [Saccharothrix obliqua]|nr:putative leader peptide [Saccharothrix obliqua]
MDASPEEEEAPATLVRMNELLTKRLAVDLCRVRSSLCRAAS